MPLWLRWSRGNRTNGRRQSRPPAGRDRPLFPPRLQQDRLEAARMAEDMARKAAAEAVRQLEEEHSAKILIDSPPESNEP